MRKLQIVADYLENGEAVFIDVFFNDNDKIEQIDYCGVVLRKEDLKDLELDEITPQLISAIKERKDHHE